MQDSFWRLVKLCHVIYGDVAAFARKLSVGHMQYVRTLVMWLRSRGHGRTLDSSVPVVSLLNVKLSWPTKLLIDLNFFNLSNFLICKMSMKGIKSYSLNKILLLWNINNELLFDKFLRCKNVQFNIKLNNEISKI